MARSFAKRSQVELAADYLISEAGHVVAIYNLFQYPFGNESAWLRDGTNFSIFGTYPILGNLTDATSAKQLQDWLFMFSSYAQDSSEVGIRISQLEAHSLIQSPNFISISKQMEFIERWNRTWDYWDQGTRH